ncbi:hypothetical protein [Spirosoma aerolatum]|uniref:hypothetical protein n=1 Tax=Spirosoma aerolatum TaxID=1211326 RepID=UPI0009AE9212|nr:hypothetical protein [Spirosoma aerolatum]
MKRFHLLPLLLTGLLACSEPNTNIAPIDPSPDNPSGSAGGLQTEVGAPTGAAISQTIGPDGGTLTTSDGKLKLTIPAGALASSTTISAQPVENKAPGGTGTAYALSVAAAQGRLSAEVPLLTEAQLTLTYTADDVDGSVPEALGVAYQDKNGVWQGQRKVKLDQTHKTVTVSIDRLAPYAFYEQFELRTDKRVLAPGEQTQLTVYYQEGATDNPAVDLVPLTPVKVVSASRLVRWTINGVTDGTVKGDNYGNVGQITEDRTLAKASYDAPIREPDTNPVMIGAELDVQPFGRVTVVQSIRVESAARLSVGGAIDNNPNVALSIMGNKLMGTLVSASPTGLPFVSFIIDDFRGKGTYNFPKDGPNHTIAAGTSGEGYAHGYYKPYSTEWVSGNIMVTITEYSGAGKPIRGTLAGTYYKEITPISVSARFQGVPSVIP